MKNYTFDIDKWRSVLLQDGFPGMKEWFSITGPREIVYLEYLRTLARSRRKLGPARRTDVFIFGRGEAPDRAVTKIGGPPYRPAQKTWPKAADGEPMVFLAQFRFTESTDLVGDLPGDVLLLFVRDETLHTVQPQEFLHFEWYPLGIKRLIRPEEVPYTARHWAFVTCFGYRYRSIDFQRIVDVPLVDSLVFPGVWSSPANYTHAEEFSRINGVKIGGLPVCTCMDKRHRSKWRPKGRFLCSLGTIAPVREATHPWVNDPRPIGLFDFEPEMRLEFADGFTLNMYLQERGNIEWTVCMR